MSLIDDAREIDRTGPYLVEGSHCGMCDGVIEGFAHILPTGHKPACPWLSMPAIVAALEAAELVTIAYEEERIMSGVVRGSQFAASLEALDKALEG